MKKRILALALAILLALPASIGALATPAAAAANEVWVSDSGSDSADGSEGAPFLTFEKAMAEVEDRGKIKVVGSVELKAWSSYGKSVSISGGTLVSSADVVNLSAALSFDNITLNLKSGSALYANGYKLVIGSNVTLTNEITLYGGSNGGNLYGNTDITVLAGSYTAIYGGSKGGYIDGNTRVEVGGSVNSKLDVADHDGGKYIYGGGNSTNITGSTTLIFGGNAKATHLFGGSHGGNAKIGKGTYAYVNGGQSMSIYAASNGVDTKSNATLIMTAGTIQQVFGGSQSSNLTGNVDLQLLGGKVTRRVYGGCYNNYDSGWKSSYGVKGTIVLTLGGSINISLDARDPSKANLKYPDRSIYARSRQATAFDGETGILVFANSTTYNSYKGKLGAQDDGILYSAANANMKEIMKNAIVYSEIHNCTYSVDGDTFKESCSLCSTAHAANAKLVLSEANPSYTGSPIECAKIDFENTWKGGRYYEMSYGSNIEVGEAIATASLLGLSATLKFNIDKGTQSRPTASKIDESIKGKNDGELIYLDSDMEYKKKGDSVYTPINSNSIFVEPGTYYVRYRENDNFYASADRTLIVGEGRMLSVTFKAEGSADVLVEVEWQGSVDEIPNIPERAGYTETAPYWSITDLDCITEDTVVEAIYTKDSQSEPEVVPPIEDGGSDENEADPEDGESNGAPEQNGAEQNPSMDGGVDNTDNTDNAVTDFDSNKESVGGCGSSVLGIGAIVASLALLGFVKKKED